LKLNLELLQVAVVDGVGIRGVSLAIDVVHIELLKLTPEMLRSNESKHLYGGGLAHLPGRVVIGIHEHLPIPYSHTHNTLSSQPPPPNPHVIAVLECVHRRSPPNGPNVFVTVPQTSCQLAQHLVGPGGCLSALQGRLH
jgi:hypothetical protein